MYRHLLQQQLAIIERGGEPMNIFRNSEQNKRIDLPWKGQEDPWG